MSEGISLTLAIIAGVILLTAGRQIFWLSVGLLGFVVGFFAAQLIFGNENNWLTLVVALTAGFLGSWLAKGFQRAAIALAGFAAGGYILSFLVHASEIPIPNFVPWIVGGILGTVLLTYIFDRALIVLSAAAGSVILTQAVPVMEGQSLVKFFLFLIIGIIIQSSQKKKNSSH